MSSNVSWYGTLELEDEGLSIEFEAEGTESYSPGRMYMPNGDPGYPAEYDCEVENIDILEVFDFDKDDLIVPTEEQRKAYEDKIEEAILNGEFEAHYSEPEPEPEEEDWDYE